MTRNQVSLFGQGIRCPRAELDPFSFAKISLENFSSAKLPRSFFPWPELPFSMDFFFIFICFFLGQIILLCIPLWDNNNFLIVITRIFLTSGPNSGGSSGTKKSSKKGKSKNTQTTGAGSAATNTGAATNGESSGGTAANPGEISIVLT